MNAKPVALKRVFHALFDAWWLDLVFVLSVLAAVLLVPPVWAHLDLLGHLGLERRLDIYTDLITISALLGGFSTLAFSAYIGWTGRGIDRVKRKVGRSLMVVWMACLATPWVAALAIGVAKILDDGPAWTSNPARWVALAAIALVILTLVRTIVILVQLADLRDNQGTPTKTFNTTPLAVPDERLKRTGTSH